MIISRIVSKLVVTITFVSCSIFVIVVPITVVVVLPVVVSAQQQEYQQQQQQQKINILLQVQKYTLPTVLTRTTNGKTSTTNTTGSTGNDRIEYYKIQSYRFLCSVIQDNTWLYDSIRTTTTPTIIETITPDYTTTTNNNRTKIYQQQTQQQQYYCCYAIYKWINSIENNTDSNYITTGSTIKTTKTTTTTTGTTSNHSATNVLYVLNFDSNHFDKNSTSDSSSNLFCTKNRNKIINVRHINTDTTTTTTTTTAETGQQLQTNYFIPTYSMILSKPIVHLDNTITTGTCSNTTTTHSFIYKYIHQFYQSLIPPTVLSSSSLTLSNTVSLSLLHEKTNESKNKNNSNNNHHINSSNHNNSNSTQKIDVLVNSTISETGGMHRIIQNHLQINSINRNTSSLSSSSSSSLLYKNRMNVSVILLLHIPRTIFINLDDAVTSIKGININNNKNIDCTATCKAKPSINIPSTSSNTSSPHQDTDQCCNVDDANSISLINNIEWTTKGLTILSHKTSSSSSSSSLPNINNEDTQHTKGKDSSNFSKNSQYSNNNNDDDSTNIDQEEPSFSQRSKEHVIIIQFNAMGEQKQWNQNIATNTNWTTAFEFGIKIHTRYPTPITTNNSPNYNNNTRTNMNTETLYSGNFLLVPIVPPRIISATVHHNNIVSKLQGNNNNITMEQDKINDKILHSAIDMNVVKDDEHQSQQQQQYEYSMNRVYNHYDNNGTVDDSSLLYLWVATGNVNHSIYAICITLLVATLGTARIVYDILQVQGYNDF